MKVIGETPPSKFNSIEPSSAPKHEIGVTTGLTSNKSAFSISIVLVSAHPLESVIITVYIPAARPVLSFPFPKSLQLYE